MPGITIVSRNDIFAFGKGTNHEMGSKHNEYVRDSAAKTKQRSANPTSKGSNKGSKKGSKK